MTETIHATCVVLGEFGILIRGPSGCGKSTLARRLTRAHEATGGFARLVGDDRVRVRLAGGRVVASFVPAIAGLVEVRGLGILAAPYEPACIVRLVVDLVRGAPDRLPTPEQSVEVGGLQLPVVAADLSTAFEIVSAAISCRR